MTPTILRTRWLLLAMASTVLVAGCAVQPPPPQAAEQARAPVACTPVSEAEPLLGNWLTVRTQKGVAGELRTLFTLQADGTMAYTEQLKRKGQPSQGLSETGCWHRQGQDLVLQTQESYGLPVELNDPIYTNRYTVISVEQDLLRLTTPEGVKVTARRMSPGYRLPF